MKSNGVIDAGKGIANNARIIAIVRDGQLIQRHRPFPVQRLPVISYDRCFIIFEPGYVWRRVPCNIIIRFTTCYKVCFQLEIVHCW